MTGVRMLHDRTLINITEFRRAYKWRNLVKDCLKHGARVVQTETEAYRKDDGQEQDGTTDRLVTSLTAHIEGCKAERANQKHMASNPGE